MNNPNFIVVEFDQFKNEVGHNYFTMTPKKRADGVNAIGIISKAGKYKGGTYAYKDIALQFASWIPLNICCSPCSNLLGTRYLKFEQTCRFRIFFTLTQKINPDKIEVLFFVVAQAGIEPATQGFSVLCYYHLSYRATRTWRTIRDSNS